MHWSAAIGDRLLPDVAWSDESPLPDAAQVAGLVSTTHERIDTAVDKATDYLDGQR